MVFEDRKDAGLRLAEVLRRLEPREPVVLALPRGGVPVGFEIARSLGAPLDLVLVRKIGAPQQPELAVGAVVDGERVEIVLNEDVLAALGLSEEFVRGRAEREIEEIGRRRRTYLGKAERVPVEGRTAIVVDDGVATGATARAALRAVRRGAPSRLVFATPVAPPRTAERLRKEVDELVCLSTPSAFMAIGQFYADFRQVSDDEVRELLAPPTAHSPEAAERETG